MSDFTWPEPLRADSWPEPLRDDAWPEPEPVDDTWPEPKPADDTWQEETSILLDQPAGTPGRLDCGCDPAMIIAAGRHLKGCPDG